MTDLPPAGWYADPEDSSQQRYWDGSTWTEHRTPAAPQASTWGPAHDVSQAPSQAPSWGTQRGAETSGGAIAALVMGILSIVACLGPITGIPAIIVGRRAVRDIEASRGQVEGRALATGGVVTGLIGSLIWVLVVVMFIIGLALFSGDNIS